MGIGAERCQRIQPCLGSTVAVELTLFFFGCHTDALLDRSIMHRHESPRLLVGAAGRATFSFQAGLDHLAWQRCRCVIPHGAAAMHVACKCLRARKAC